MGAEPGPGCHRGPVYNSTPTAPGIAPASGGAPVPGSGGTMRTIPRCAVRPPSTGGGRTHVPTTPLETPVTPEERAARNAAMLAAAAAGVPRVAIAEQFGLSLSRTSVILGNAGAPPPAHGRGVKRDLDYRGYREKYEAGATIRALAEAAGVGFGTMHRGLELAGTTFRHRGGRGTQT